MLRRWTILGMVVLWSSAARAEIIVNDPLLITRRVTVQLIQTALDNGSSPATVFGNDTQRADIEAGIDQIWAQAGIDILFLPTLVRYNNTFAYQGNNGTGTRPTGDLSTIRNNARSTGGILNSDANVLNMFFVNVVPGFTPLGESNAAGLAWIAGNGIAAFSGDGLLTFANGRDVIASVMAHEIGHNLGLDHTASGDANLMSPQGRSEQLNASQISTSLNATSFARLLPIELVGDYDGDGVVNPADYSVWRDSLGRSGSNLAADGNGNGSIDNGDYTAWKTNFGDTSGAGGIGAVFMVSAPEPGLLMPLLTVWAWLVGCRKRNR